MSKARVYAWLGDLGLTLLSGVVLLALSHYLIGSEFASRAAARITAPVLGFAYGPGARERISVLLIDDESLVAGKERWPVSYGYHAELIETLASYAPKAIFLDFLMIDERPDPTLPSLIAAACGAVARGIPVAIGADPAQRSGGVRPEIRNARTAEGKPCFLPLGVTYDADKFDRLAWTYPFRVESHDRVEPRPSRGVSPATPGTDDEGHEREDFMLSAAFGLYELIEGRIARPANHGEEIALVWGTLSALHPLSLLEREGHGPARPYCQRFEGMGNWRLFSLLFPEARPACVFHETTMAHELRGPDSEQVAQLGQRFGGRVVLVGASLAATGDTVISPVHDRIPGVYLHAMALDNLLAYGGVGKESIVLRDWRNAVVPTLEMLLAAALLTVATISLVHAPIAKRIGVLRRNLPSMPPAHAHAHAPLDRRAIARVLGYKVLRVLFGLLAMAILIWFGHVVLHVGILGYIEIAMACLTAHFFHFAHILRDPIRLGIAREIYGVEREHDEHG